MTFNEALKCKKKFIIDSSNYTQSIFYCLIIPAKEEEAEKYINDFKNSPSSFIDESCKTYCSNADFRVMVIPTKDFASSPEEKMVNILDK